MELNKKIVTSLTLVVICFLFFLPIPSLSNGLLNLNQSKFSDSTNKIIEGKKEGYWIVYGKTKNNPKYLDGEIFEEGEYKNNRKEGVWKKYYPGGLLKSEITYISGRPIGSFKTFFPNGQLEEKGCWKGRVYIGYFERYYEDGTLSQKKKFNKKGKTEGVVKYYHSNGQLELSFSTDNGKEVGMATRFWPNGDLKEEIEFNDEGDGVSFGIIDRVNPKFNIPIVKLKKEGISMVGNINLADDIEPHIPRALFDGYNKTYNENKDILMDGEFLKGKLMDGKHYIYDENGLLERIEVYKSGKFIGMGVI
jgi:antitoxin component YwqK of YwqJK toxin-antitoxin module